MSAATCKGAGGKRRNSSLPNRRQGIACCDKTHLNSQPQLAVFLNELLRLLHQLGVVGISRRIGPPARRRRHPQFLRLPPVVKPLALEASLFLRQNQTRTGFIVRAAGANKSGKPLGPAYDPFARTASHPRACLRHQRKPTIPYTHLPRFHGGCVQNMIDRDTQPTSAASRFAAMKSNPACVPQSAKDAATTLEVPCVRLCMTVEG